MVSQVLAQIADLLEIKGDNAFKVRAYRTAAETIATWPQPVATLDDQALRAIPGIGKDLAARISELAQTGTLTYHQELLAQFPPTILDLLRLQGVGPKTVALLYSELNIRTVEELAAAAADGRLRTLKGMGAKKEALILKAIAERAKDEGRHLLTETSATAADLVAYLQPLAPGVEFIPVGSLRRGCETCGDIDILAVGGDERLMDVFSSHPRVERILGHGDTKTSVRLTGGYQADLRLVPRESRGAAMQYFTGSKAHNIAVRDRAVQQGLKLNEYGLFRVDDDTRLAGETEEGIYQTLGMSWVAPELRELRGEIEAAVAGTLPALVSLSDLRGDLHMHSTATDGRDEIAAMAAEAKRLGREYIAITDHSKALAMANGLDEQRALEHAAAVRALNGRFDGLTVLAGIECDILPDGSLDLSHDCLAQLDIVIASVHSQFSQDQPQMTERVLKALECPWVDVLGHPTGRLLLKREPLRLDMSAVIASAARHGVALEINCQPDRLDLGDAHARLALEHGLSLVISTDAHSTRALQRLQWGVLTARRAWARPTDVLNTLPVDTLRARLRRNRSS
ncbi:MAG TPA: DNA polymerase/3'-5' exonuclease PolX [Vicinamibacterales bacterium]|jgi:DNA polymerase (family 10)